MKFENKFVRKKTEMNTEQLTNFIKNISSKYNIPVEELNSIRDSVDSIKDSVEDSVKATYSCRCGSVIKNEARGIQRHENTKKHLEFIKKNEIPDIVNQTEQQSQADEDVVNRLNELVEEEFGVEESAEEEDKESADKAAGTTSEVKQYELHKGYCEVCIENDWNIKTVKKRQFFSYDGIFNQCCLTCYDKFVLVEEDDMWYLQQEGDYLISIDNPYISYRHVNLVYGLHPREHIDEKTTKKEMISILKHHSIGVKNLAKIKKKELYDWIKNELEIDDMKEWAKKKIYKGP
tara:strand:- start:160 stop:1032 length:873 start_codon:yes stop_codon:yes gene_type:complete